MRIEDFQAEADLVGRRLRVAWTFAPDAGETLADVPPVRLRRKLRDFDYPTPSGADPYLVYDSAAFPPAPTATLTVTDLPPWETIEEGRRTAWEAISIGAMVDGRPLEVLRRTLATGFDAAGRPAQRRVEILDAGLALRPGVTYYYQLSGVGIPPGIDVRRLRATATAGEGHGLNRYLYDQLPAIFRRHDVVARPSSPGSDSVPEMVVRGGQLRRVIDVFGAALDALRSSADNLRLLHDIDAVDHRYLPWLAQWIGWRLSDTDGVPLHRNEIKEATRLYRSVGTVPGLGAIVTRYSGWNTQVTEFAQHIALSNDPPRLNLYGSVETSGGWLGANDASAVLGFGPGNLDAAGGAGSAAALTGSVGGPFALRPGMEITLVINGGAPSRVRFGPSDFASMAAASAAEVAAVLDRSFHELTARVVAGGRIQLATIQVGADVTLSVVPPMADLVTLEAGSAHRPAPVLDGAGRLRVALSAEPAIGPAGKSHGQASGTASRLVVKTFAFDRWYDARPLAAVLPRDATSPAAALLPDGRLFLAWIEDPHTAGARIASAIGSAAEPDPARLFGAAPQPFALRNGTVLTVALATGAAAFTINAADYADPGRATAAEVVAAIAAQASFAGVSARVEADGSISLATAERGPNARLAIDLRNSTAARALGFATRQQPAIGSWDDALSWSAPQAADALVRGHHADPFALADPAGGIRLFWSRHQDRVWHLVTARWLGERSYIASAAGIAIRDAALGWTSWSTGDGLASDDVRALAGDADGSFWAATAAGAARRRPDGSWTVHDAAAGLPSDDVRDVALAPDGSAWFATGGGIGIVTGAGVVSALTTADGLADNDVRRVVHGPDGTTFAATAGGLGVRPAGGAFETLGTAAGLPSIDLRCLAVAPDGQIWAGTAGGLARRLETGSWEAVPLAAAQSSPLVRDLAIAEGGDVWIATGEGAWRRRPDGSWTRFSVTIGLLSNDVRAILPGARGEIRIASAGGLDVLHADGRREALTTADGLASNDLRRFAAIWSADLVLAAGGRANREPTAVIDGTGGTRLVWSQQQPGDPAADLWLLRQRLFDPATLDWGPEQAVTTPPAGSRVSDRTPAAVPEPGGDVRVFFSSDRGGARNLHWLRIGAGGVPSAITDVPPQAAMRSAPAPVRVADGTLLLLHLSDASVPFGHLATPTAALAAPASVAPAERSGRLGATAAVRRFAGTTAVVTSDLRRLALRRDWNDLLSYTPQKPRLEADAPLQPDEFYTRGTVGLYVSPSRHGRPLTRRDAERLQQLLREFLPINLRTVIVLAPTRLVETVPMPADSFSDVHPFPEGMPLPVDSTAAALPDWFVLLANAAGQGSAEEADLTSLRGRTFFGPPR